MHTQNTFLVIQCTQKGNHLQNLVDFSFFYTNRSVTGNFNLQLPSSYSEPLKSLSEKTNKKQQQLRSNMSLQEKQTHLCHLPEHRQPTGKSHSLHPEVWDIRKTLDLCLALPSELLVCTPSNQVVQYCLCQVICGR